MARVRSTNPVGVARRDIGPDAPIYSRWLRAAVGDAALAHDLITGANSTTAIDHSGAPNGCQLRMPLASQYINRALLSSSSDEYYILAVPIFVRVGETGRYRLTATISPQRGTTDNVILEIRDSAWSLQTIETSTGERGQVNNRTASDLNQNDVVSWTFNINSTGLFYVMVRRFCGNDGGEFFYDWYLDHVRSEAGTSNGLAVDGSVAVGSPYNALADYTPANVVEFYDEEVDATGLSGLSAFVTSRLNRRLNGLWEYVTGSRIPGNNAYQQTQRVDNNRAIWANEARLQFPIAAVALGASQAFSGGKNPVGSDMQSWIRYPTTHNAIAEPFASVRLRLPSFSTSTSALKCTILIQSATLATSMADWRFNVTTGAGSATEVTPVQLAGTQFWRATVTSIPFTASATDDVDVTIRHATGGAFSRHVYLLGACFYFEP
jgi:hypothetical protein